jgi:hypothetical protein
MPGGNGSAPIWRRTGSMSAGAANGPLSAPPGRQRAHGGVVAGRSSVVHGQRGGRQTVGQ